MEVIDLVFDSRINGYCATIVCSYSWYLNATSGTEANLDIQRGIIKDSRAYRTLRADLRRGCVLPPTVLAISHLTLPAEISASAIYDPRIRSECFRTIKDQIDTPVPSDTYIIDGLQRTNAMRQTLIAIGENEDERSVFLNRPLRVELWLNIQFSAIAYRMLLLNAGQKPMSIKHQIEILSMKLMEDLATIDGIDIKRTLTSQRRTGPGQFTLANLSQAYQAWLHGSPNIDVRNLVMEQLLAESAIETLGTSLSGEHPKDEFKALVEWFVRIDNHVFASEAQFFGNETVLLGIAAAVGAAQRNEEMKQRTQRSLEILLHSASQGNLDALSIERFNDLRSGADVRKVNVGQFSRELVYRAFQELFLSDGNKPMEDCWAFGAAQS